MRDLDLENVQEAQDFEKPTPGGYICGITAVEDVADKEYLKIEYDFAEGPLKNYYRGLYEAKGFWGGTFVKSYKEKALPFFKGFITAVENSNKGYKFKNDETTLKRRMVGLVLGEEEYVGKDGTVKTRLYVDQIHSVDVIKKGDFKIPELKKLPATAGSSSKPSDFVPTPLADDDDLPF